MERRLATIRDLAASAAAFSSVRVACDTAARIIGANSSDIGFCLIYVLEGGGARARLTASSGIELGDDVAPPSIELSETTTAWPPAEVCRGIRAELLWNLPVAAKAHGHDGIEPPQAALVLPIVGHGRGRRAGILVAGVSPLWAADDDYHDYLHVVAGQVAAAIALASPDGREPHASLGQARGAFPGEVDETTGAWNSHLAGMTIESINIDVCARLEFLRDQAEAALRESEERFARFMRHLPGLAWIKDLQGRYVYANESAEAAFRTPRQDLYGKDDDEVFPPEVAAQFRENDRRALESESGIQTVETLEHEDKIIHHSIVSKFPIPGSDDRPALIGGIAVDITELVHAQELIREREERLRRALDEREEALKLHCDIENKLTLLVEGSGSLSTSLELGAVSSAILALSRRLLSADAYAIWQHDRSSGCWRIALSSGLSEVYQETTVPDSEQVAPLPSESIIAEDITIAPTVAHRRLAYDREGIKSLMIVPLNARCDREGAIAFYYRQAHQFSEVEARVATALSNLSAAAIGSAQLYDELRTNNQRKDEFLAMLAHELRNPLAVIETAISLLRIANAGQEEIDRSVGVIGRHVKHLTRLIEDLLDVSRITTGKIQLRKATIDARSVLESAIESVRPLFAERQHRLTTTFGPGLVVESDPTRLEQIAVNLLLNAAKYTERNGHIWFSAAREGNEVAVRVRDNGVGIAADELSKIFDMFVQGERSLERSAGGLGIGLTLVQKLTELHGGTVEAKSEGAAKGSEFVVRLPAAATIAAAPAARTQVERSAGRPARILVVDDNIDLARGLARLLEVHGHTVAIAHDGPSGLDRARQWRPEFVLLDIGLPGMDGYQVAALLRQDNDTKDATIIAISGYGQEEDRRRSREAGFDRHLVKPISSHDLLRIFENRA